MTKSQLREYIISESRKLMKAEILKENDSEDEIASRGIEYGINPYHEQPDFEEDKFDFIKRSIESASGDKVEKREIDDEGEPLYWSLTNDTVNYYIGGDNGDDIIKYNGETGERYPIGNLKHYDEPRREKDSPDSLYFENNNKLRKYISLSVRNYLK